MYILYGGELTRGVLVQWVLEEGRIEYEPRTVDIYKGEHRTAEFLAINPAGLVPVLITPDGDALYEVGALMVYLADRHQLTELAPAVTDQDRGLFLSTVFHIAGDIQYELKRVYYPHRYSLRREDNLGIQNAALTNVMRCVDVMNVRLSKRGPYVLGNRFSLADFYLSFWVAFLDQDLLRKRCPAIAKLYDLVRARPSATPYLERAEAGARYWAEMMKKSPTPVVN